MEFSEVIAEKEKLQIQIRKFLQEKLVEFSRTTGVAVDGVRVSIYLVNVVGQKSLSYIVDQVDVRLIL